MFPTAELSWRRLVPNLATGLTLLLGLGAIEAARFGDPALAVRFILLAVLADGLDGVLARRWGVVSSMGGHLDALADIVAFGVAPAVIFAATHPEAPGPVRVVLMAFFVIGAAWRLARFQAEPARHDFVGLPTTVAGPLFALLVAGAVPADLSGAAAWGVGLAVLMVSTIPYPRILNGRLGRAAQGIAVGLMLALAADIQPALLLAQLALMAYVVVGLAWGLGQAAVGGRPATGRRGH